MGGTENIERKRRTKEKDTERKRKEWVNLSDMGTGEVVRKAGGRRSYEEGRGEGRCEELWGRWDAARKEVERRIALRNEV